MIEGARASVLLAALALGALGLSLFFPLTASAGANYPPSYSRRTVVWRDGGDTWILDVVVYSEMPWYVGGVAEVELSVTLVSYLSAQDFEIALVGRLIAGQRELASKFLGSLSAEGRRVVGRVNFVVSPLEFPEAYLGPLTRELTVVLEGYVRGKQHSYSLPIPAVILSQSPDLSVRVLVNGVEDYYVITEALSRLNVTVLVTNVGRDVVLGGALKLYLNFTLVGEKPLARLSPGETSAYGFSVLRMFGAGVYMVRAVLVYALPSGAYREVSSICVLEVVRGYEVILSVDKHAVVEGGNVTLLGRVEPPLDGVAFIERLEGNIWVTEGAVRLLGGSLRAQVRVGDVPLGMEFVRRSFRVRVPISLVGGRAELVSRPVVVTVFSADRVLDMVTDLSMELESGYVFAGASLAVRVRVRPPLPACLPVKVVYISPHAPSWVELGEVEVCGSAGVANLTIDLPPGRYLIKSVATSRYRLMDSLPRELVVLAPPILHIEKPERPLPGDLIRVIVRVTPALPELTGFLEVVGESGILSNISLRFSEGVAEASFRATAGTIDVRACALASGKLACAQDRVEVIPPAIHVSPSFVTVEAGQSFLLTVVVSPERVYALRVSILRNGVEHYRGNVTTDRSGAATVSLRAPEAAGRYVVRVALLGLGVYSDVQLNVIEAVRTLSIKLPTRNVRPSDTVTVRVTILPQPQSPRQVIISIFSDGRWLPVAYDIVQGRSEASLSFKAPEREGVYQVRAEVPELGLVSNVEQLEVGGGLLSWELVFAITAAVAIAGALTAIAGGRRR